MEANKKAKTVKMTSKRLVLRGAASDGIVVTSKRKAGQAQSSLRGLDPKTVEILVDDKIATGG